MQVLASQLPFLGNRNAELAVPPLFWPVNCIKIGGHVALLSGPTVYTLYCDQTLKPKIIQILKNKENNTDSSLTVLISRGCDHVRLTFSRESIFHWIHGIIVYPILKSLSKRGIAIHIYEYTN